jgi:transcriptional regulator with XRE-family HTH domain
MKTTVCYSYTNNNVLMKNGGTDWVEIIEDLRIGADYSYSDIARLARLSISEIQKLATGKRHEPTFRVYHALLLLYCKTFYGANKLNHAAAFLRVKKHHPLAWLEEFICQHYCPNVKAVKTPVSGVVLL